MGLPGDTTRWAPGGVTDTEKSGVWGAKAFTKPAATGEPRPVTKS